RAVGERSVRLADADEGDAGRVVRVPVAVRIDGPVETRDQLVTPAVDLVAPGSVRLPAGDSDREVRRPRRDAVDPLRPLGADEKARQLGAVPLAPVRALRIH